jgi:DNA-binding transcriptional LysR family regulator
MTLQQFKIFATAAKHGNVTRASKELHITQPSVSQQLRILEQNYRVKLYKRVGTGIELTKKGRGFLRSVQVILKQYDRLKNRFGVDELAEENSLSLGGSRGPAALFLPSVLSSFKRRHGKVNVSLTSDKRKSIEKLILASKIDIALVTTPPDSPEITHRPFRRERWVVFARPGHPLARKPRPDLHDLSGAPLILRRGTGSRNSVDGVVKQIRRRNVKPSKILRYDSPDEVKNAVRNNKGVGILFHDLVAADVRRGQFKIINVPRIRLNGRSFVMYHGDKPLSNPARDFISLLRKSRDKITRVRLSGAD